MTETQNAHLTADLVLLAPAPDGEGQMVLLVRRRWEPYEGCWALPGGYIDHNELPEHAARRELLEETGLDAPTDLELVGVWADPHRDPRGRVVTWAYTAHIPHATTPRAGDDARDARWWPMNALPDRLAFDHAEILAATVRR